MTTNINLDKGNGLKISLDQDYPGERRLERSDNSDGKLEGDYPGSRKLKILDLFSGTGAWVEPWKRSVTYKLLIDSLDIIKRPHINLHMDIKDFIPQYDYDIVYASPPCTHFSQMRQINKNKSTEQDILNSLEIVDKTFKIAKTAKLCYIIENPYTGSLKKYYPTGYQVVDYSEYGYPMRKRTAIWSNIDLKLKTKTEISYNRLPLQYLSKDDKWRIPKKLSDRIKNMIIKKFNKELQEFK